MADFITNLKIVEHVRDRVLHALSQGINGRSSRYFDPGRYMEFFQRFQAATAELRALDPRFVAVLERPLPESSKTTDFQDRGYLLRQDLEMLKEDAELALSIARDSVVTANRTLPDARKIFVVHGRNIKASTAMFDFLRSLGLAPIEWREAIKMTGKGTPYVGEVLDVAFAHAQAIVVVFTGDDLAQLDPRLAQEESRTQPRPNVLFEAGMALGRSPDRTIIVEVGPVASFSDIHGRHTVRMDGSAEKRRDLVTRLKTAQCLVEDRASEGWLRAGDFASAVLSPTNITAPGGPGNHFLSPYIGKKIVIEDRTITYKEFVLKELRQWDFTLRQLSNTAEYTISIDQIDRYQIVAGQMILFLKRPWGDYQVGERMAMRSR